MNRSDLSWETPSLGLAWKGPAIPGKIVKQAKYVWFFPHSLFRSFPSISTSFYFLASGLSPFPLPGTPPIIEVYSWTHSTEVRPGYSPSKECFSLKEDQSHEQGNGINCIKVIEINSDMVTSGTEGETHLKWERFSVHQSLTPSMGEMSPGKGHGCLSFHQRNSVRCMCIICGQFPPDIVQIVSVVFLCTENMKYVQREYHGNPHRKAQEKATHSCGLTLKFVLHRALPAREFLCWNESQLIQLDWISKYRQIMFLLRVYQSESRVKASKVQFPCQWEAEALTPGLGGCYWSTFDGRALIFYVGILPA